MSDLRAVGWLRWRQLRDGLRYFFRMLGYESGQTGYALYLTGILIFWVFAMGAYSIDQTVSFGRFLFSPESYDGLAQVVLWVVFAVQSYALFNALRSTPLKLTFADMSFIAPAPLDPSAPVVVDMIRQTLTRVVTLVPALCLMAVFLASVLRLDTNAESLNIVGRVAAVGLPVVVLTWTFAWLLGVMRLASPALKQSRALWLVLVAWLAQIVIAPQVAFFGGNAVLDALNDAQPGWLIPVLWVAIGLVVAGVVLAGKRINMTYAADESQTYARIQALGLLAYKQFDLVMSIRMQGGQSNRKPRFRLSPKAMGRAAISQRAALLYLRHPLLLITSMLWVVMFVMGAYVVISTDFATPFAVGWVLLSAFISPVGLHYVYRTDLEESFLRQLLPVDGVSLLIADATVPFIAMFFTALGVWGVLSPDIMQLTGALLIVPLWLSIQTLCGALAMTRPTRALQVRLMAVCLSYLTIALGFAAFGVAGAGVAAVFVILTLAGMVGTWG